MPNHWLISLMDRAKLNWNWKIDPEQRITIEFADFMRQQALEGGYHGVWFHVPNEGKRHKITACIMKAMGMLAGVPDFIFIWKNKQTGLLGAGFIEMKTPGNKQSPSQKDFQAWAEFWGIPYAVHNDAGNAAYQLKQWGAL